MEKPAAAFWSSVFFVTAPGVVAGLTPLWLTHGKRGEAGTLRLPLSVLGVTLMLAGLAALVHAFTRFVREGRGTPAPVAPTERLVVGGLYRHVRNPMYLAILAIVLGEALVLARPLLLAYAGALWATFAVFVRAYEEPALRRRFGDSYEAYRRSVSAWIPRLRPWNPAKPS